MLLALITIWIPVLAIFSFGACIGSFLNVVIFRLPAGQSLLYPPSRCPKCLHRLTPWENIPVLGWLRLRGRCQYCQAAISSRYPLIEASTGLLFIWIWLVFGWAWQTPAYWLLTSWLLALSMIDFDTLTLPNALTKSGLVVGLIVQMGLGWLQLSTLAGMAQHLLAGILGATIGIWALDLVALLGSMLLGQQAMGAGDAKLAAMLGAWLGWQQLLFGCFLAALLGTLVGGIAIATGHLQRRQAFPFGPFLAGGALLSLLYGQSLWQGYLNLFFPSLLSG